MSEIFIVFEDSSAIAELLITCSVEKLITQISSEQRYGIPEQRFSTLLSLISKEAKSLSKLKNRFLYETDSAPASVKRRKDHHCLSFNWNIHETLYDSATLNRDRMSKIS